MLVIKALSQIWVWSAWWILHINHNFQWEQESLIALWPATGCWMLLTITMLLNVLFWSVGQDLHFAKWAPYRARWWTGQPIGQMGILMNCWSNDQVKLDAASPAAKSTLYNNPSFRRMCRRVQLIQYSKDSAESHNLHSFLRRTRRISLSCRCWYPNKKEWDFKQLLFEKGIMRSIYIFLMGQHLHYRLMDRRS